MSANKNLPVVSLVAGSFAAGIAGAFVYNQYLVRVRQEEGSPSRQQRQRQQRHQPPSTDEFPIFNTTEELSTSVLNHLTRVYTTLGSTAFAAALGVLLQRQTNFSPQLASLISLGFALSLATTKAELYKLLGFGLFNGMGMGQLVGLALKVNSNLVPVALASTSAVFASFAAAATLSPRRSLLYLYGVLGSALSVLSITGLVNVFAQNRFLFNANLYGGLAMFVGYVCADSQMIIERADLGDRDYVSHAWMLFTDLSGIFTRLLVILIRQQQEQQDRRRRRGRDEED
ncbi:hypothetical protein BASA81_004881 [Batrachochytrium salamandrivorans]|nr:hypothetical protein BASA81_004881 [Batrachochytrium salamandrivorans]